MLMNIAAFILFYDLINPKCWVKSFEIQLTLSIKSSVDKLPSVLPAKLV